MKQLANEVMRWILEQRYRNIEYCMRHPHRVQETLLSQFIQSARRTEWGKMHDFRSIRTPQQFAERIPLQDYESLKPYIHRMMLGEPDVLWHGMVDMFAKSSGTTNDKSKFIPVSRVNLTECHHKGAWDTMSVIYRNRPDSRHFLGKSLLMGGSAAAYEPHPATTTGDVSALMIGKMPFYFRPFFTPDFETALLKDWDVKIERMARIISHEPNLVMIGGVPTWTVVLLRRVLEMTGKSDLKEVWPDLQVYVHGGVSFLPYREQFKQLIQDPDFQYVEIYNATEGYFAVQDDPKTQDMLLLLNNGIYYELLPMTEWGREDGKTIPLAAAQTGVNYALVISTNSGLWRYLPGDTIQFTSVDPYKIRITGRTKQYINAFGEEVMVDNTDRALAETCRQTRSAVREYTVAPVYFGSQAKGGHEWLVEFDQPPDDLEQFAEILDRNLQNLNSDYEAKRFKGMALERLKLSQLPQGTFYRWLRSKGKYGGQHKVPRLSNDRKYVDEVLRFVNQSVF
mgnify:FL=1